MNDAAENGPAAPSTRTASLGVAAAIAAISVAGLGFGHSVPLFAVLLDRAGATGVVNGGATAIGALAVIAATPAYPRLIARLGLRAFLLCSIGVMIVAYAAIYAARDVVWTWYPLRFAFSAGASGLFVGSEVWINGAATKASRGRLIGLYSTCLALGFAAGPVLLERTGFDGARPFVAGGLVFCLALVPVALARPPRLDASPEASRVLPVLRQAPVTFGASAVFAAVENAVLVFLPLLALSLSHGEAASARVVLAYGCGLVALQYVVGRAADRFGVTRVLVACPLAAAAAALSVPLAQGWLPGLYAAVFVLGGFTAGVSTAGLVLLGDRFEGRRLAAASTGYSFAWGLGAIAGPSVAGVLRDTLGFSAIFLGSAVLLAAYALAAFARRGAAFP